MTHAKPNQHREPPPPPPDPSTKQRAASPPASAAGSSAEPPRRRVELPADAGAWVLAGFAGFGSVLGFLTGASETAGIAQSLLTGLLAFVGGGLLSLVGFVFKSDETPQIRAKATGQALVGLAAGTWLGLALGITARLTFERHEDERIAKAARADLATIPPQKSASQTAPGPSAPPTSPTTPSGAAPSPNTPPPPPPSPVTQAIKSTPAAAPASPTKGILLHADPAACAAIKRRIQARRASGYYDTEPEAEAADRESMQAACEK